MRPKLSRFFLPALLLLGACATDQSISGVNAGPETGPRVIPSASPACQYVSSSALQSEITSVFTVAGWPDASSALSKLATADGFLASGNIPKAQSESFKLITFILKKWSKLPTMQRDAQKAAVDELVNNLYCHVGLVGATFDLNPGDPVTAVVNENATGGVWFPANAVSEGTTIAVAEIPPAEAPLIILLDKYPAYLEVEKFPDLPLNAPVVIAVCYQNAQLGGTPIGERLLVGHQRKAPPVWDPGTQQLITPDLGFEILQPAAIPSELSGQLNCNPPAAPGALNQPASSSVFAQLFGKVRDLFLPQQAVAFQGFAFGGVGGSAEEFSPFGAVDPYLYATGGVGGSAEEFSPAMLGAGTLADPIRGNVNTQTTSGLPTVTVKTGQGTPIPGVAVTFSVSGATAHTPVGAATTCLGYVYTVVTNGSGQATMPCLAFGPTPGYSNIKAQFDPSTLNFPGASQVTVNGNGQAGASLNFLVETLAPSLPIAFLSSGYRYLGGIDARPFGTGFRPGLEGTAPPGGWETAGFADAGWAAATAPFTSDQTSGCAINITAQSLPRTSWPINTDILVRRTFSTPSAGTITIRMYIDNDALVYLDGAPITPTSGTTSGNTSYPDWRFHDGCPGAAGGDAVFSNLPVAAGNHVIAVRGHDYGGSAYFDMSVTFTAAP